ncbi:hypothetical protein L6164_022573 [Bauhinia variegata]|uniref:Uncharacterized protein n=1 Tax=Bauhinia variegata TaxID=167791 RepID=A0ACB9MGX4_BAUVA|nr:hypothetical protein L6164_022573 [Bauhinia variegata]
MNQKYHLIISIIHAETNCSKVAFSHYFLYSPLLAGKEEDLAIASALRLNGTDEETEAEGRRRGVTALLEVSLAMGEGVDGTTVTGCNSIWVPAAKSVAVPWLSIN